MNTSTFWEFVLLSFAFPALDKIPDEFGEFSRQLKRSFSVF